MKIESTQVRQLTISEAPGLDPIQVVVNNLGGSTDESSGKGQISIACYGKAWTAYWGGMGKRTLEQFFLDCNVHYLANRLSADDKITEIDVDKLKEVAVREIITRRREGDLDRDEARNLFDNLNFSSMDLRGGAIEYHADLLRRIFGDDWGTGLPIRSTSDYNYLCRIVEAVKLAFQQELTPSENIQSAMGM